MRALLAIDTGHLFDPPYPPVPVLLSYRRIYFAHIPAFQSPMNRIINRTFTEHSKIIDIYCQGALRKIAERADDVLQICPLNGQWESFWEQKPLLLLPCLPAGRSIKSYIPFSPQVCGGLVLYFSFTSLSIVLGLFLQPLHSGLFILFYRHLHRRTSRVRLAGYGVAFGSLFGCRLIQVLLNPIGV